MTCHLFVVTLWPELVMPYSQWGTNSRRVRSKTHSNIPFAKRRPICSGLGMWSTLYDTSFSKVSTNVYSLSRGSLVGVVVHRSMYMLCLYFLHYPECHFCLLCIFVLAHSRGFVITHTPSWLKRHTVQKRWSVNYTSSTQHHSMLPRALYPHPPNHLPQNWE